MIEDARRREPRAVAVHDDDGGTRQVPPLDGGMGLIHEGAHPRVDRTGGGTAEGERKDEHPPSIGQSTQRSSRIR